MTATPDPRLAALRGPVPPVRHNARTIAALTGNPGCARRAVLDAAGVDKTALAQAAGFPARFGQSPFAISRGNAFEAQVKADGCAQLRQLLAQLLGPEVATAGYLDLAGAAAGPDRSAVAWKELTRAGGSGLFDHPLLRLSIGGQPGYLEPDLVAVAHRGQFHVVEIKSFPVIDGQADGTKVAAAAIQSAVYVLALRDLLGRPKAVSHDIVLVCPENFTNRPVAVRVDVRRQLSVLEHQLARLVRIERLLDRLPAGLSFDLSTGAGPAELSAALGCLDARYTPDCLSACELAFLCRDEAAADTAALGRTVREDLGGVPTVDAALDPPADVPPDVAALLRTTARIYAESV